MNNEKPPPGSARMDLSIPQKMATGAIGDSNRFCSSCVFRSSRYPAANEEPIARTPQNPKTHPGNQRPFGGTMQRPQQGVVVRGRN